jgi:hypothetical protein
MRFYYGSLTIFYHVKAGKTEYSLEFVILEIFVWEGMKGI